MAMMAMGAVASQLLVKYNRKGFMLDKELRQEREFQEQDLRIKQFTLYREDVRDLVNLTTSKMDLYLIISALLADKTFLMVCKSNEALPAPEWALELNVLSLGSGVLYLMLSMWLAIYASVAAHAYGTRMLVQFVRLPIASEKYLQNATAQSTDFEAASVADMLRIPFAQRKRPPAGEDAPQPSPTSGRTPVHGSSVPDEAATETTSDPGAPPREPQEDMLPTAMLEHIRLYRKVQLHWQAYDAYARVALFLGANCIIYSCLYWCLGQLIENQGAWIPELGTALIFATLQLCLSRLDLRLRRGEAVAISIIVFMMPLCTTSGMVLFKHLEDMKEQHATAGEMKLIEMTMEFLAFIAHLLHAVVGVLVLLGATWPERAESEKFEYTVYLPGKFRAVLYLDVFGWLANTTSSRRQDAQGSAPTGSMLNEPATFNGRSPPAPRLSTVPEGSAGMNVSGATIDSMRSPSFMEDRTPPVSRFGSVYSDVGSTGGATPPAQSALLSRLTSAPEAAMARISTFRRQSSGFDLRDEVQEEATNIFLGSRSSQRNQPVPGTSTASMVSASSQPASLIRPATQVEAYGGDEAIQRSEIEQDTNPTAVTTATFLPDGSAPPITERRIKKTRLPGERPWHALRNATLMVVFLWCFSAAWVFSRFWAVLFSHEEVNEPVTAQEASAKAGIALTELCSSHIDEAWLQRATSTGGNGASQRVKDMSCGLQRAGNLDVSVACSRTSAACTVAVLHRGGRSVSLCLLGTKVSSREGSSAQLLRSWRQLRLAPGAAPLTQLALAAYANQTEAVRLYAHANDGATLALRILRPGQRRQSMLLAPYFDVAQAGQMGPIGGDLASRANGLKQTLLASADTLFSVSMDHKHEERVHKRRKRRRSHAPPSVCRQPGRITSKAGNVDFGLTIKSWSMRDGSYKQAFLQGFIGVVPELLDGVCADHQQEQLGYRDVPRTAPKGMYF